MRRRRRTVEVLALTAVWGVIIALVLGTLAGCAATARALSTPEHRLRLAADAYATALEVAADHAQAGLVAPEQAARLERKRRAARAALDAWRANLGDGVAEADVQRWNAAVRAFQREVLRLDNEGRSADE
ncbi:MAG: hypothetical protein ACOC7T_01245 [Planctomycetota bacterium]